MLHSSIGELIYANTPIAIILVFTLIPLLIGSVASHNSIATIQDFFICGRSMGTTLSFFTVYATWWSSFAFLGSISYFYSIGSVYWTAIAWNVLFGILYMWFGSRISDYGREKSYITPIDFFADIYESKFLNKIVTGTMIIFTIPYIQIQFYGGAIIIEIATKGIIPWQICAFMFYLVMIIYLWAGGLRAVAWADIFYGVLIFFGMLAAGFILISEVGGVDYTFSKLIAERTDLIILPKNLNAAGISLWIAMFIMMPIGALMGPQMWIRMYATKEKRTFYIMPLLISLATIAYLGSMFAGSAAVLLKSGSVASSDTILPLLLVEYAPGWLMAIVMCCGAAACLSTANSDIHAVSSLISLDIYKKYIRPKSTEKHLVFVAKISIIAFSAAAYFSLILSNSPASIVLTGFTALSGMAQLIVPVLGALIWKKSNASGAISGLLIGVLFTIVFSFWKPFELPLPAGLTGLILNAAVFILCGLFLSHKSNTTNKITLYKIGSFEDFTTD